MLTGIEEELTTTYKQQTGSAGVTKKHQIKPPHFLCRASLLCCALKCWRSHEEIHPQSPNLSTFLKPPSIPNPPHSHADGFQCGTDGAILGSLLTAAITKMPFYSHEPQIKELLPIIIQYIMEVEKLHYQQQWIALKTHLQKTIWEYNYI